MLKRKPRFSFRNFPIRRKPLTGFYFYNKNIFLKNIIYIYYGHLFIITIFYKILKIKLKILNSKNKILKLNF